MSFGYQITDCSIQTEDLKVCMYTMTETTGKSESSTQTGVERQHKGMQTELQVPLPPPPPPLKIHQCTQTWEPDTGDDEKDPDYIPPW